MARQIAAPVHVGEGQAGQSPWSAMPMPPERATSETKTRVSAATAIFIRPKSSRRLRTSEARRQAK
jgi:cytochrome c551/c552